MNLAVTKNTIMKKIGITFFMLANLLIISDLSSQDIGYGFKAGLNFNHFLSDSETDANGNELETFSNKTGFHVGAIFTWKATELMGLRGEFLFSQKGGKYRYEGESFYTIQAANNNFPTTGFRDMTVNVSNSYIDIPIMGYVKLLGWLEFSAGANVGLLISSTGFGSLTYRPNGIISEFTYELDYRYGADNAGDFESSSTTDVLQISGDQFQLPRNAGAYYEYPQDEGHLYKTLDFGLVGGVSFYLNKGLYVGIRANYGLTDTTNEKADVSWHQKNADGTFIKRKDDDRNFSLQTSVGFSF